MRKFLLSIFLLYSVLFAAEYPKTFAQLGTPLYKSVKPITKYSDIKLLEDKILTYTNQANRTMAHGFEVGKSKDKAQTKKYLFELRKLQKSYDYLLHLLHDSINAAIDAKDYKLFLKLTNYEFDGLLKNSNLKKKSLAFYNEHRAEKRSSFLDKKIKHEDLVEQSTQEFYNEVVESTYNPKTQQDPTKKVLIEAKRSGNYIYVTLINRNIYDVTVSVEANYKNMTEVKKAAKEVVLKANSTRDYTKLKLGKGSVSYGYRYSWIIGSKKAVHDAEYLYRLPFATGKAYPVSQGFNTTATHKGRSKFAVDFAMDVGTKIYAARGGVVVKTKSDSNKGGYSKEFAKDGNYVMVAHSDGTFGSYYHLKQYGVLVKEGDVVKRGFALGYSGNTGYSSGPHLHFSVIKTMSAQATSSLPIKFISQNGVIEEPRKGVSYVAK